MCRGNNAKKLSSGKGRGSLLVPNTLKPGGDLSEKLCPGDEDGRQWSRGRASDSKGRIGHAPEKTHRLQEVIRPGPWARKKAIEGGKGGVKNWEKDPTRERCQIRGVSRQ